MAEKARVKVVPHADGYLEICCGDHCIEVEAHAPVGTGDDLSGGLTPPDAMLAARESLIVLTDGEEGDRDAIGLVPVDALTDHALENLERIDADELSGPAQILSAASTRRDAIDLNNLGEVIRSGPEALTPGTPLRVAVLGGRIGLDRLEPLMDAVRAQDRELELHVLTGGEVLQDDE